MTKHHRKRTNNGHRDLRRKHDLRRRTLDNDQIQENIANPKPLKLSEDLPGFGRYYCTVCDRHFPNSVSLESHLKSKQHKHRVKVVQRPGYHQEDADLGAGMTREPQSRAAAERLAAEGKIHPMSLIGSGFPVLQTSAPKEVVAEEQEEH